MRVKAKHWLKHEGKWYKSGESFEVSVMDYDALKDCVDMAETPLDEANTEPPDTAPPSSDGTVNARRGRGRPRKNAE